MREYMITLGSMLMMVSIAEILMPEGGIKKFASLAMGFMIITVAVAPISGDVFKFETETFGINEESMKEAQRQYEEKVLAEHRKNLTLRIQEHIKHGSEVSVEVTSEGILQQVTITLKGDESSAVAYIVETLKLPRERIKLIYENN